MSHARRLKELGNRWKDDKPSSGGRSTHPLGTYQGKLVKCVLEEGKKGKQTGHLMVRITIKGVTGEATDKLTWASIDLDYPGRKASSGVKAAPSGISRFKGFLEMLEIDLPKQLSPKSIEKVLERSLNCVIDYAVVQNGQWTNTYMNRLVHAADDIEDEELEDEVEEDEEEDDTEEDEEEETEDEDDEDEEEEEIDLDSDEDFEEDEPPKEEPKKRGRPKGSKNKKAAPKEDPPKAKKAKKGKKKAKATTSVSDNGDEESWDDDWE